MYAIFTIEESLDKATEFLVGEFERSYEGLERAYDDDGGSDNQHGVEDGGGGATIVGAGEGEKLKVDFQGMPGCSFCLLWLIF